MNILMTSVYFYPHIGGIETVTEMMAEAFAQMDGVQVRVVTATAEEGDRQFPFPVYRNPDRRTLWRLYRWCDVFIHQGISLKWVWPRLLWRKPWFIVYHQTGFQPGLKGRLKAWCARVATDNICVSETTARGYALSHHTTILNAYAEGVLARTNTAPRKDIVYLGKLWKDKGLHVLLDAFEQFKDETGSDYQLRLIGTGGDHVEEYEAIVAHARSIRHCEDVHLLGPKHADEIAALLNEHKLMVVPSVYQEAFGIVCLEGMACGCIVIGSDGDGIAEAINGHGFTFRKGDSHALCAQLKAGAAMTQPQVEALYNGAKQWLRERSAASVAQSYVDLFEKYL